MLRWGACYVIALFNTSHQVEYLFASCWLSSESRKVITPQETLCRGNAQIIEGPPDVSHSRMFRNLRLLWFPTVMNTRQSRRISPYRISKILLTSGLHVVRSRSDRCSRIIKSSRTRFLYMVTKHLTCAAHIILAPGNEARPSHAHYRIHLIQFLRWTLHIIEDMIWCSC